ncbi:GntR family transcriptional regulator [Rhizobium sp. PP-CC-2G-626]|nr:GntR family transcriptional regulator [Rhizobium sp. PP-CC-2G-626]
METKKLYQQIADQIRELILSGGFLAGMRLPSERDLALQLGVSRPSLREGLIALELEGVVEIKVGSGVYVLAERSTIPSVASFMGESPSELMEARIAIEGTIVLLAAARITDTAVVQIDHVLSDMGDAIAAGRNPVEYDRNFHMLIAAQCGNAVLEHIVANLFDERHSPLSTRIQDRFGSPETWLLALREHRDILAALKRRDILLAQALMRSHLEASRQRWVDP